MAARDSLSITVAKTRSMLIITKHKKKNLTAARQTLQRTFIAVGMANPYPWYYCLRVGRAAKYSWDRMYFCPH